MDYERIGPIIGWEGLPTETAARAAQPVSKRGQADRLARLRHTEALIHVLAERKLMRHSLLPELKRFDSWNRRTGFGRLRLMATTGTSSERLQEGLGCTTSWRG